jgi:hypothetical protein
MRTHIFVDSSETLGTKWQEISHWEYFKKRIQFWKYRKHRTMGRPILMRWLPTPTKQEEKE